MIIAKLCLNVTVCYHLCNSRDCLYIALRASSKLRKFGWPQGTGTWAENCGDCAPLGERNDGKENGIYIATLNTHA